jgi:hypothetical protein
MKNMTVEKARAKGKEFVAGILSQTDEDTMRSFTEEYSDMPEGEVPNDAPDEVKHAWWEGAQDEIKRELALR